VTAPLPDVDAPVIDGVANALEDYVGRRHGIFGNPAPTWLLDSLHDEGLAVIPVGQTTAEQTVADLLALLAVYEEKPIAYQWIRPSVIRSIIESGGAE